MIVVADSGPLHYLVLLEQADLLRRLYEVVLIPEAVAAELRASGAPRRVREWLSTPPPWITVVRVSQEEMSTRQFGHFADPAAVRLAFDVDCEITHA